MTDQAQELRDAAQRLRTLAEAATPGPWEADLEFTTVDATPIRRRQQTQYRGAVASLYTTADTEFIAAMHPGVALALADWLAQAAIHVKGGSLSGHPMSDRAIAVARLINGSER